MAERLKEPNPPVLLDVRTIREAQIASLPGSVLIPIQEFESREDELEALRGREVVVYCHLGVRSLHGAAWLENLGINASSLRGGIDAWSGEIDPSVPRY
ncbi:MAG: rhodanese-like domain-containing protein [Myxococcaceae bacterium]